MSIDPGVLLGLTIILLIVMILCNVAGFKFLGGILGIIEIIFVVILLLKAAEIYEEQQPLRDYKAAYAEYAENVLESYGYTEIEIDFDLSSLPDASGLDEKYSPEINAAGKGDPDFTEIRNMIKELNSYQDKEYGNIIEADRVMLTFNGECGRYSCHGDNEIEYATLLTGFKQNQETGEVIPEKPIRGMGKEQINNTLLGEATTVTDTEEGTFYLWVTGERDNYEAIVTDGHVSCVRVMDTWRGSSVFAEDKGEE